jgi:integrase
LRALRSRSGPFRTSPSAIRRVELFGLGLDAARRWMERLPTYAKTNPHGIVFATARGCRRPKGRFRYWKQYLKAIGITRRVRFHDLRHTCASSLVAGWWGRAWRLEEVKVMLGHYSVTMTERYAHLAQSVLRTAAHETETETALAKDTRRTQDPRKPRRATLDSNQWPSASEADALSS